MTDTRRGRWVDRPWLVPALLLLPSLVLFVILFLAPLATMVLYSLYGYSRVSGMVHHVSLANYASIWLDPYYLSIILLTLKQGAIVSVTALLTGYPVALFIVTARARIRALVMLLVLSPLLISVVVRSFGWQIILGPGGPLDRGLTLIGIKMPLLLHTQTSVIIGLTSVFGAFMILSIVASLQQMRPQVPLAAASLGANRFRVFWHVTLPLSLPGVLSGLLIVFSLSSSAFISPAILGGPQYRVLATQIFEQTLSLQNWPFGAALSISLIAIVFVILTIQTRLLERGRFHMMFR